MLISNPVFAIKPDTSDKRVMSIFELGVRPDRDNDFADVARQTISASVDHEEGTLAMYALQRSDNPRQAFMVEFYENESAYRKHLNAAPYKAFAARAPDIIDRKKKITLEPQFLGDKHIIANERTINNLVIVEVKPVAIQCIYPEQPLFWPTGWHKTDRFRPSGDRLCHFWLFVRRLRAERLSEKWPRSLVD
ncbi:Antibiotic biosynthesis monooxygenase [Klebsiella pneumoniae]|jgi:quinol monooxygenase YgiN|nr:Antibiotic biosynthesis monooxygenase [Klebsiella pneumoniae]SVQ01846.1 Antibiotic biosynthesis monooxygenase [Klebsiella pneumoniae]SVT69109.1 Antibiotic biosynthesis monooxygenase [Klebsiella pneumoniae]VAQ20818.1 Antibiotic biosynthesis monooxygenase [Klebsiella pneumoniae]VGG59348.1 Antibiotic biosynthesis monooxygenase [Klebsiella pneumoniae]